MYNVCMAIPPRRQAKITFGVRLDPETRLLIRVLARHSGVHDSEFLVPTVKEFVAKKLAESGLSGKKLQEKIEVAKQEAREQAAKRRAASSKEPREADTAEKTDPGFPPPRRRRLPPRPPS